MFTTAQKGWNQLLTHAIVEVAKALGGSFKLVTLVPKTVREMTQLPKETQKNGDKSFQPITWQVLLTHAIVEVAKALGGSFKLVMPAPKPVREMTQLLRETQKDGDTQTN